jgi:zinc D-Ala-D-Ala carboxypeptidase
VSHGRPLHAAPQRIRIRRIRVAGLIVVIAAIAAVAASRSLVSSSLTAAVFLDRHHAAHHGALGEADGAVPPGTTPFNDQVPGVTNLNPALLAALRRAATDASDDGVEILVNSGWRTPAYENHLRREAIAEYGSAAAAARWVATGTTSAHVSGDAVDLGPADATSWLSTHGAAYGLCQIYANEPWHYELRPAASAHGCPPMYADPTQDPRMHK